MHDSFEERLQRAMQFRQDDDLPRACALFVQLLKEQPENKVVLGMLSACYFESKQHELAANYARQSVAVSPTSELSSLILFHSL